MLLATINKSKRLLVLSFIGEVQVEELVEAREEVVMLLADLGRGFRVLADLGRLDSISISCAPEIGKVMELCEQKGVELVVRLIPDQKKDIGLGILSHFHYRRQPRVVNCTTIVEAVKQLSF